MKARQALTLIELIIVLSVLVAISGVAIPIYSDQLNSAAQTTTKATLSEVQRALQDYWQDTKLIPLDGITTVADETDRFDIQWLFKNPVTDDTTNQHSPNLRSGWNGPYLLSSTVSSGGPNLVDAWNNRLEVQYVNPTDALKDVRIVSMGPDGILDIAPTTATSLLTTESIGDDIYVAITLR